jgi:hypothetical protein
MQLTAQVIDYAYKAQLPSHLSATFQHFNTQQEYWLGQIQGFGDNYDRYVGGIEKIKKAEALAQQWLKA